jgi:hypothetical protein
VWFFVGARNGFALPYHLGERAMKKNAKFFASAVLSLSLGLPGVAFAEVPAACDSDRDKRFYDLGVFKGRSLVDQAYASLELEPDETLCDCFEDFHEAVVRAFEAAAPPVDSPRSVLCHYAGSYEGAIARVDELTVDAVEHTDELAVDAVEHTDELTVDAVERADELSGIRCLIECYVLGRFIGEMAATFYCDLSIALGGLGLDEWLVEGSITFCGVLFVYGCHRMFDYLTPRYPSVDDPQCLPYTQAPYLEVYAQARHNQCIYDIEE